VIPQFTAHSYGLFHALAVFALFVSLVLYLPAAIRTGTADTKLVERRTARHAGLLTLLYLLCNFVFAKFLFDLRQDPSALDWHNYLRLEHYRGGFWGWPAVFLPLALAYPFVFGLARVLTLRAISLALPGVLILQKAACFAAGCCAGVPTDLPWGVAFPRESLCPTPGVSVHPVQLYDVLVAIGMSVVVSTMDRFVRLRAFLFPVVVGLFGASRFATDFWRPEFEGALSLRQCLASGAAVVALLLLVFGRSPWRALLRDNSPADDGGRDRPAA
jgi:prolipoprotein diacylglyceryltransferase